MKDSKVVMGNIRSKARRGISLIEVLVVLVLLVLGILIIVRLFPSGFFSINSVGDAALADGLGQAAVSAQAQNATALPESILPGTLTAANALDGDYDPDDPNAVSLNHPTTSPYGYDLARVVNNETITVPAASGPNRQSIYVVNYGPIVLPVTINDATFTNYLTINSPAWKPLTGNFNDALGAQPVFPQNTIFPGQSQYFVDYTNGKVAVPYSQTYTQAFAMKVVGNDGKTYNVTFAVPKSGYAGPPVTSQPADFNAIPYPDTTTYYNGGWFDPVGNNTDPTTNQTYKYNVTAPQGLPPAPWKSAMLSRAFKGLINTTAFSADPFEYKLTTDNIADGNSPGLTNLGAIEFNPVGAGRSGSDSLKAQISYQTSSWKILHEDRDVAPLSAGETSVARLTLKNIKRAGDSGPDNIIDTGLVPGSYQSMIALDLDTGQTVGSPPKGSPPDPTLASGAIWDEDLSGPKTDPTYINISFSTGRVTFGSNVFGDNGAGTTPHAHRVRLYYQAEGDWTVAVQKAPSYYTFSQNSAAANNDPQLLPGQCAYDPAFGPKGGLYFPHSDAGKSVEIDGTYIDGTGAFKTFAATIAISNIVTTLGTTKYVTVALDDQNLAGGLYNTTATQVKINAVRGLSARAVVAWKERDRWKVHTVDTVLTRAQ